MRCASALSRSAPWILGAAILIPGPLLSCAAPSSRIAYIRSGEVRILNVDTGEDTRLTQGTRFRHVAALNADTLLVTTQEKGEFFPRVRWHSLSIATQEVAPLDYSGRAVRSPVDTRVAYTDLDAGGKIFLDPGTGGDPIEIYETSLGIGFLAWSPDARHLAIAVIEGTEKPTDPEPPGLRSIDVASGQPHTLFEGYALSSTWSPNGKWLAFAGRKKGGEPGVWVVGANGKGLRMLARTHVLSHGIHLTTTDWDSSSSRVLYTSTRGDNEFPYRIFSINRDGTGRQELQGTGKHNLDGHFSPDGSYILFIQAGGYGGKDPEVWIMNPQGKEARKLLDNVPLTWLIP